MTPIAKYLSELKAKKGLKSDRQFAIQIGISTGMVCNILAGANVPSDEACKKIATFAGDPLEKVLLLAAESRAPESTRKAWEKIAKASGFLLLAYLWWTGHLHADQTALPLLGASLTTSHTMDIMSNIKCRLCRGFCSFSLPYASALSPSRVSLLVEVLKPFVCNVGVYLCR